MTYKALVCVFLNGGMDCHDTVLPYDESEYNSYSTIRKSLLEQYTYQPGGSTRVRERLIPLNPVNSSEFSGRQFALPETLKEVHELFSHGKAAIIANVGPLIQPLDKDGFNNPNIPKPPRVGSHNDHQMIWMTSYPEGRNKSGWGGMLSDLKNSTNTNKAFSKISVMGNSPYLLSINNPQFQVETSGPQDLNLVSQYQPFRSPLANEVSKNIALAQNNSYTNYFEKDLVNIYRNTIENSKTLKEALKKQPTFQTQFQDDNLSQQLKMVARIISTRNNIGCTNQIFFVGIGGFDTHSAQANHLTQLHRKLSQALKSFYDATVELGVDKDVTAFTASDFGRTLTPNGDGTDHGWGGHHFVVGGSVQGNRIIGKMPPASLGHSQDAGQGILIPTLSVDQYGSALAKWFGASDTEITDVFPYIGNFDRNAVNIF